ncbi:MAG TPA: glycoside hydrolase family 92 protein, partial [Verrucomicrobiae bacterium]|nr:glycoside hydrolase family 92 protein [Verrucomicrobiae bacterium]
MNKVISLLLLGINLTASLPAAELNSENVVKLDCVNLLQGTDSEVALSHGNTLPLVGAPWGMVDWSIENGEGSWFFHPNGKIDGIRATHQPSPWISDYGQFVFMPQTGALRMDVAERRAEYDTTRSILRPDYERLELQPDQITTELSGTERGAAVRLTFHQGESGR